MNTERRYLYNKTDSYLFSFDVGHQMMQAGRGWNLMRPDDDKADDFDVFHVRGESVVNDRETIVGNVLSAMGHCDFRSYGDTARATGKVLLRTRDGVVIETLYYGASRLQELGQRQLLTVPDLAPIEVKLSYWLRFETSNAKYRWLAQTPCVGFGRGLIQVKPGSAIDEDGFPESLTFDTQLDVYALS